MASEGGNQDNGDFILYALIGVCIALLFVFTFYSEHIANAWRWIRIGELYLFSWIPDWAPVYGELNIRELIDILRNIPSAQIDKELMSRFDAEYGKYFSWPLGLILLLIGYRRLSRSDRMIYRKFDMESLLEYMAPEYPFLQEPLEDHPERVDIEYDRQDLKSRAYSMSVTAESFVTATPPLGLEKEAERDSMFHRPIMDDNGDFDEDLAQRAFAAQLGSLYAGPQAMNDSEQKVYQKLQSRILASRDTRMEWATRYARSAFAEIIGANDPSVERIDEQRLGPGHRLFYKYLKRGLTRVVAKELGVRSSKTFRIGRRKGKDEPSIDSIRKAIRAQNLDIPRLRSICLTTPILERIVMHESAHKISAQALCEDIMARHAFTRVGLMRLLREARKTGELSMKREFYWLKKADRTLWYALHSEGRRTPLIEGAGCFAHLEMEELVGRPIPVPEVTMAVEALMVELGLREREDDKEAERAFEEASGYGKDFHGF